MSEPDEREDRLDLTMSLKPLPGISEGIIELSVADEHDKITALMVTDQSGSIGCAVPRAQLRRLHAFLGFILSEDDRP